ncbi:MAG: cytochrome P460 family protein [Gaiellaceae bacterium]
MPARVVAIVAIVVLAASAVVVAVASTTANGLPAYTNGYQKWPKLNRKPFRSTGPLSSAHTGLKNVYASKRKVGKRFPNGSVIVKTIVKPGTTYVGQFAVMRKLDGRWRYVEYERSSPTAQYTVLDQGALCQSCHVQARSNDYVFTKR